MKKLTALILALVMCFALCACGSTPAAPADQGKPSGNTTDTSKEPASKPAAPAEKHDPISLTFACYLNEAEPDVVEFMQPWLDMIVKDCADVGYDVEFECYWGASLCSQPESYKTVIEGTADMAFFISSMTSNFPYETILGYPWNGVEISNPSAVYEAMIAQFPEMQEEFYEVHPLLTLMGFNQYLNSTKEFHSLAESKGVKWSAAGAVTSVVFDKWGWTGVALAPAEVYSGLERNLVEGIGSGAKTCFANAWYEVADYRYSNLAVVNQTMLCIMNQDTWSSLPAEVQEVFDRYSSGGEFDIGAFYSEKIRGIESGYEKDLADKGMTVITIGDAELDEFCALIEEARDEWAAEQDAAGKPGTEMLEYLRSLFQEYDGK